MKWNFKIKNSNSKWPDSLLGIAIFFSGYWDQVVIGRNTRRLPIFLAQLPYEYHPAMSICCEQLIFSDKIYNSFKISFYILYFYYQCAGFLYTQEVIRVYLLSIQRSGVTFTTPNTSAAIFDITCVTTFGVSLA